MSERGATGDATPVDAEPLHCLLLDDSLVDRVHLERTLATIGRPLDISPVGTVTEARLMLSRNRYDVLIVDYRLPDGDGLSLLNDLACVAGGPPPAILITGEEEDGIREAAHEIGYRSFVSKHHLTPARLALSVRMALAA